MTTAASRQAPAWQKPLDDVRARKIDVVVYKVDRLTRSLADFPKLVELFDEHDVSFISVMQASTPPPVWVVLPSTCCCLCAVRARNYGRAHPRQTFEKGRPSSEGRHLSNAFRRSAGACVYVAKQAKTAKPSTIISSSKPKRPPCNSRKPHLAIKPKSSRTKPNLILVPNNGTASALCRRSACSDDALPPQ